MSKPLHPVERFFVRYNLVTFIAVAALSLAFIVYLCYDTYKTATTPSESARTSSIPETFDPDTVRKIKNLHTPADNPSPSLPENVRINPFVE